MPASLYSYIAFTNLLANQELLAAHSVELESVFIPLLPLEVYITNEDHQFSPCAPWWH